MDGSNFPFARLYSLRSAVITCITFSLVGVSVVFFSSFVGLFKRN